ncbi:MAG: D-2-hydroxyacid dehydrogenase [Phycisphaeraceae bacterium]
MPHILIDHAVEPSQLDTLQQATGLPVMFAEGELGKQRALPHSQLRDACALLCTHLPSNHEAMQSLKLVQLCSAGFRQVENLGLSRRDVQVCTASGVNDIPIAEWTVMMILALTRNLPEMIHHQMQGVWDRDARFQTEARGKTLGIWGYGGIGRETAQLASAMGLSVHVLTRSGQIDDKPRFRVDQVSAHAALAPDRVFAASDAKRFCESVDFLMLAMPDTPENLGLIDHAIFEALPQHAYLLNPARGKLVNEDALLDALRSGRIAGAALDTHFAYPLPASHPLWQMRNVIITPHIAGSSQSSHYSRRLWQLLVRNLKQWQAGAELFGTLTPQQLDPNDGPTVPDPGTT